MRNSSAQTNPITQGVIWKQLLFFFFPIAIGTLFQQLYNTVDAVIVGRYLGKEALASVGGSAAVLSNLVIGFFTGLSAGATVIISQFHGAKDKQNLHSSLHTAYGISIIISIVLAFVGWFLTPWMLRITRTQPEIMESSTLYLRIYFLGMIAVLIFNMGSSIMRAIGDSKRPLYYLIICCFLNIILDLLFVVVFHMGVEGAAIATILAQAVSALLVTHALIHSYDDLKLSLRDIKIDVQKLKAEMKIGFPSGLQSCMYGITNIIIQTAINKFGTDTTAAWAAYGKLDAIFWAICGAFGIAITTFAGQNLGAKRLDRVFKSLRVCLGISLGTCGTLLAFLVITCQPLYTLFTTDPNVIKIGVYMLMTLAPSYLLFVLIEIYTGALRGMGDVCFPTLITLGGVCCIRIPWIVWILPLKPTLATIIASYPLSWIITILFLIPYYYHRKKQLLHYNNFTF